MPTSSAALTRCLLLAGVVLIASCTSPEVRPPPIDPDVARAEIAKHLPPKVDNRDGWAIDIFAAFEALSIRPTTQNICPSPVSLRSRSARSRAARRAITFRCWL